MPDESMTMKNLDINDDDDFSSDDDNSILVEKEDTTMELSKKKIIVGNIASAIVKRQDYMLNMSH